MRVLLTVPHASYDVKNLDRNYDVMARYFAVNMKAKLDFFGIKTKMLVNDKVPRSKIDMNRPSSRNTSFRIKVDRHLVKLDSFDDVLIDVHSFPREADMKPDEIYFLEISDYINDDYFTTKAREFLVDKGISASVYQGDNKNDIVVQAMKKYDLWNVALVEIFEELPMIRVRNIARLLAAYIQQWSG